QLDDVPLALRQASSRLSTLIKSLPQLEHCAIASDMLPDWALLREREPDVFLILRARVRLACGRAVNDLLDELLARFAGVRQRPRLHSVEEVLQRPPQRFLVDGLLADGLIGVIGESGCGKSFL